MSFSCKTQDVLTCMYYYCQLVKKLMIWGQEVDFCSTRRHYDIKVQSYDGVYKEEYERFYNNSKSVYFYIKFWSDRNCSII